MFSNVASMALLSTAVDDSPPLRYDTAVSLVPLRNWKISPARCGNPPGQCVRS